MDKIGKRTKDFDNQRKKPTRKERTTDDDMVSFKEIEDGEFMITTDVRHGEKHFFIEDELANEEAGGSKGHWGYNPNSQSSQVQVID